jgi:membrane protease YdiL (CAAX protease family)
MIDKERLPERFCPQCGHPLNDNEADQQGLCHRCRGLEAGSGLILEHLGRPQAVAETTQAQGDQHSGIHEITLPQSEGPDIGVATDVADAESPDAGAVIRMAPAGSDYVGGDPGAPPVDSDYSGAAATTPYADSYDGGATTGAPADSWDAGASTGATADGWDAGTGAAVPPDDPDHPPWGISGGIAVWLFSVLAIIIVPILAIALWLGYESLAHPSMSMSSNAVGNLLTGPSAMLVNVISIFGAHVITLAIVWAVVTRFGRYPFFATLGWRWAASPGFPRFWFVVAVVFAMYIVDIGLGQVLPQSHETDFEKLLKTSQQVRIAVALLAVLTAPWVEEFVYRGVLFSALISRAGVKWTVTIVTALFALVHFPQYWGAWSALAGISVLSLTLTIVRAKMKSIFPCIAIHFLFNVVGSLSIIWQKS